MATERRVDGVGATALLLIALLCLPAQANDTTGTASIPRAWDTLVELDGAGGVRVLWRGAPVLELDLTATGGLVSDPGTWSRHILRAGADGIVAAPAGPDAVVPRLAATLTMRARSWNYFHLDETVFLDAALTSRQPRDLSIQPGVRLTAPVPEQFNRWTLRPHRSAGRSEPVQVPVWTVRAEDRTAELLVAVVRLDLAAPRVDAGGVVWPDAPPTWPLAVVTAPCRSILEVSLGHALMAYAGEELSAPQTWAVPPLCARCQSETVDLLAVELRSRGADLEIALQTPDRNDHLGVAYETVVLAGHRLGRFLSTRTEHGATYRLARDHPVAVDLLQRGAGLRPEVTLNSGVTVRPTRSSVERDTALPAASYPRVPSHLAAHLIEAWPNPFHERTVVHIRVPATLGEAFDFRAAGIETQGIDLSGAPPFGRDPAVRVRVYNVSGQLIRDLDDRVRTAGEFQVSWDGSDDQGRSVAAGAYYVNVDMEGYSVTRRVLLLNP